MKPIRVNKYLMPVLVVAALLGSVWVAKAAGLWLTSGRGDILLDESGQPDPAGIKGWMTLADLSDTYGLPLDVLYVMIGAEADVPAETALKDLEKLVPGLEVWAVREAVAAYLAGAWSPDDGRYGAGEAAPVVIEPTPTPEPTPLPAEEHVPLGPGGGSGQGAGDGSGADLVLPEDGSRLPGSEIKGRMTLQEVVDYCQVPLDYLVAELGLPADVDGQLPLRDLAGQLGIEVLAVREAVERYQAGQ